MGNEENTDKAQNEDEGDESWAEEFDAIPSTLPPIGIDLSNFATEAEARALGQEIQGLLTIFGKVLDLRRLKQVLVAYNYDEALAGVAREPAATGPLTATRDDLAVGVAMTPTVFDEGVPKAVMVINAAFVQVLAQEPKADNADAQARAAYLLAHESAHVHDLEKRASSIPDSLLKTTLSLRESVRFRTAMGCWEEYIACRLSAFMGKELIRANLEETFCSALDVARDRANAAIRQYRMHADLSRVTQEVTDQYRRLAVYAAYLQGHIDGMDQPRDEAAPKAEEAVERNAFFKPFYSRLHECLRAMYASYGNWTGLDVYEPLKELAEELLKVGGFEFHRKPDGSEYVNLPFTAETTPTLEEAFAYRAGKMG